MQYDALTQQRRDRQSFRRYHGFGRRGALPTRHGASEALSSPQVDTLAPTSSGEALGTYGLKTMCGLRPEGGVAALRINSDVQIWPTVAGNVRRDRLPSPAGRWNGLVILYSMSTGEPLMISPDGYISRLRVGATNALAARYLAREDSRLIALLGTGWRRADSSWLMCCRGDRRGQSV